MPLDVLTTALRRSGSEAAAISFTTKMNDMLHQLADALKVTQAATANTASTA